MFKLEKLFKFSIYILLVFTVNSAFAFRTYTVQVGETLSSIVESQTSPPPPLYGEGGRLEKVLKLNPNILDPNDIRVGDVIILSGNISKTSNYEVYPGQVRSLLPVEKITNPLELMLRLSPQKRISYFDRTFIIKATEMQKKIPKRNVASRVKPIKVAPQKDAELIDRLEKVVNENIILKQENSALQNENKELQEKIEEIKNPIVEIQKIQNQRKISSQEPALTVSEKKTSNEQKKIIIENDEKLAVENTKPQMLLDDNPGVLEFGLGWGPTFYLHNQTSNLGTAQLGTLFLNNIEFFTAYHRDDFKLIMKLGRYSYNYDDGISSSSTSLLNFTVDTYFNNFIYGISFDQQPLLKNTSGKINVFTDTVILPRFGYFLDFELSKRIETRFQLIPVMNFSAGGFSSDPSIEFKEHSGFGLDIDTRLIRRLNSDEHMKIYYFWDNGISYRSYQRSADWGIGNQDFESTHTNFNSTIGISIKFDN